MIVTLPLLLLLCPARGTAQESIIKGKIVDTNNRAYELTGLTVSGMRVFHLKIGDAEFKLDLEKIRSLAVVADPGAAPPFQGFILCDIVLTEGTVVRAWVDFENYLIEGTDEHLGVKLTVKLTDVVRLDLTAEPVSPAPAPTSTVPL